MRRSWGSSAAAATCWGGGAAVHAAVAGVCPGRGRRGPGGRVGARLSERLAIPDGELRGYGTREQTRTGHLREIARYLGWRTMDSAGWKELEEFLFARAMEHDAPKLLFR